jgi:hypothetical protein
MFYYTSRENACRRQTLEIIAPIRKVQNKINWCEHKSSLKKVLSGTNAVALISPNVSVEEKV